MKLDRRQLRRIINEEASMLGISLNEIMGVGGFNEPVSITYDPNVDSRIPAAVQDGRTGRFVVVGAIYTDAGKPIAMSPRSSVKLVSNVYDYPKSQPLYDVDTGEIVKSGKHMTFKFVDTASGTYLNSKEAAFSFTGKDDNFVSILREVQQIWSSWIDSQDKDQVFDWLDNHSRIDITNLPSTASRATSGMRAPTTQERIAQALGRDVPRASVPPTGRATAAPPPTSAGAAMRMKVNALISAADAMKDLLEMSDESEAALAAIEAYLTAVAELKG